MNYMGWYKGVCRFVNYYVINRSDHIIGLHYGFVRQVPVKVGLKERLAGIVTTLQGKPV